MFKIIEKKKLNQDVSQITVEAKNIARKAKPGQFVVLLIDEKGERIPLTLSGWDKDRGEINLIFQRLGSTTNKLDKLNAGDAILHILGPLGNPSDVGKVGEVICIGGGVGIAEILPVSFAFKENGNRVIGIIGARNKELLILEKEMKGICDEFFVTTDDGSYGRRGYVSDVLGGLLEVVEKSTHTKYPDLVYAIGPVAMMKAVSRLTLPFGVKTRVSLNPIMVDATGMCGACRCTVDGETVFGCVDGPDFDAQRVDFEELEKRLKLFQDQEDQLK